MDAYSTESDDLSNFDKAPILIAASSEAARARAMRTIQATGARIAGDVTVAEARERIERQVSASAVWLELDEDCGGPMDELLTYVNRDVANGRYAVVVSASSARMSSFLISAKAAMAHQAGERLKVADPILGLAEDALAIGSGLGVLSSVGEGRA